MRAGAAEFDLSDPAGSGVFPVALEDFAAIGASADEAGLLVRHIDLEGCVSKLALLQRMVRALDVPDGFGGNWDALADSLGDLSWLPALGYVLLLAPTAELRTAATADFAVLLDILEEAAAAWREIGVPFWCFVDSTDEDQQDVSGQAS